MGNDSFLRIHELRKGFGEGETRQEVLQGMTFTVAKGEFCVILGPSGSGKSTLLNIIGGIDQADSGFLSIDGDKMKELSEKAITKYRRMHLGYVFQMYNLIPNLNVKENIEVGAYLSENPLDVSQLIEVLGLKEHHKVPHGRNSYIAQLYIELYAMFIPKIFAIPLDISIPPEKSI